MPRHGFIASLLLVGLFVLLATLTSIKTLAERSTFASDIRPILESSCQPCHFQGGQMYEKLPFDKSETITKLGTKLFTRIKNEDQQRVIREFLSNSLRTLTASLSQLVFDEHAVLVFHLVLVRTAYADNRIQKFVCRC